MADVCYARSPNQLNAVEDSCTRQLVDPGERMFVSEFGNTRFNNHIGQFNYIVDQFNTDVNEFYNHDSEFNTDVSEFSNHIVEFTNAISQFQCHVSEFSTAVNQFTDKQFTETERNPTGERRRVCDFYNKLNG